LCKERRKEGKRKEKKKTKKNLKSKGEMTLKQPPF
jgi:hypothetical protein